MHQLMPKASQAGGRAHQHVPGSAAAPGAASPALTCPETGAACPALAALFGHLAPAGDEACAWVRTLAPCTHCRVAFEAGRDRLRRARLGQREREVLLAAAAQGVLVLTEPGMSRSLSASRRRAAQTLTRAGLVAPQPMPRPEGAPGPSGSPRAAVALTALGRYVMAAYGRFLTGGKPVRWTRPARGVVLPGRDPAGLRDEALARTETALRDTLAELKGVLIAAVTRPQKNPGLLDSVTRHLEQKATLLKAVLAPARDAPGAAGA